MRFLMVTSFFPPHHFGGDAVYVRQLVDALRIRGHDVDVVYCYDAYRISGGKIGRPKHDTNTNGAGVVLSLESRYGSLSPLITQMTGQPGLKWSVLKDIFDKDYDVVHFHNMSLIGGPGILPMSKAPLTLFTAHEHWTVCPTHIFWKYKTKACDSRQCFLCQIRSGRPPQLWRYTNLMNSAFESVDHVFAPSKFTKGALQDGGIKRPISVLPLFAPASFEKLAVQMPPAAEPTFLFVGRVTRSKGIVELIKLFSKRPSYKLKIVGEGDLKEPLCKSVGVGKNIEFLGRQSRERLPTLYRQATAVILPSLAPESFGLTTIEGFAQGTPAIVRDAGGAGEIIEQTGAGIVYRTDAEALDAMDKLASNSEYRDGLGEIARQSFLQKYTERHHVDAYMGKVAELFPNETRAHPL